MFSVTNAPVALVAQHLQIPGEVWVFVQDEVSWEAAFHFGTSLIETGREKRVIVAAADELSDSILAIHEALGFFEHNAYSLGEGCVAMVLEAESLAHDRQAHILGTVKSGKMVQDVSCGPMDFCVKAEYFKKLHDEMLLAQEKQLAYFRPNNCLKEVKECWGDLPPTLEQTGQTFSKKITMSNLIGDSGVIGGFGLAAGILGQNSDGVYVCTSSRGGIIAGTLVLLEHE
jgi:3-oxoacyl-[acyl-carrier-protein] synthase III